MKNTIIYIVCIVLLLALLNWLNKDAPASLRWKPSFSTLDKQPYGAYALDRMLETSWEKGFTHSYDNIIMLKDDGVLAENNLLILTDKFEAATEETDTLLSYVRQGGNAFIAARFFDRNLLDTLGISVEFNGFNSIDIHVHSKYDTEKIRLCAKGINYETYRIPSAIGSGYLTLDKTNRTYKDSACIIALNVRDEIIGIRYQLGKGNLILSANPLIYTNYGILNDAFKNYIWNSLAYLKDKPLVRTEYYMPGSRYFENNSPLRVLMSKRALKWAFYTTLLGVFLFMICTAKRRQRAIPVVKPPANQMLGFVYSIAGLYLRKNNNADIVRKKYTYWADYIKQNYGIDSINEPHDTELIQRLGLKTGKPTGELETLFKQLDKLDHKSILSDAQMIEIITIINSIT